jgi:RNA polymerase sigma-70 factor (ECF subfamily)
MITPTSLELKDNLLHSVERLPVRAIAERWAIDAAVLHHEYAKARQEFKAALAEIVVFHHPGEPADIERESANLLDLLK